MDLLHMSCVHAAQLRQLARDPLNAFRPNLTRRHHHEELTSIVNSLVNEVERFPLRHICRMLSWKRCERFSIVAIRPC